MPDFAINSNIGSDGKEFPVDAMRGAFIPLFKKTPCSLRLIIHEKMNAGPFSRHVTDLTGKEVMVLPPAGIIMERASCRSSFV